MKMDTDLIDDLRNDLAVALIVERRYAGEVRTKDVPAFIGRVVEILSRSPQKFERDSRSDAASANSR